MDQFLAVLREFEAAGGKGVVYGGCLRDTYCGISEVKDIDIAVEDTPKTRAAIEKFIEVRREDHCDDLFGTSFTTVAEVPLVYGNFPDVVASVTVATDGLLPVNFVILNFGQTFTKQLVAERCDFGICQIALDGQGVFTTEAFSRDFSRKTFTYLQEPWDDAQYQRSCRRFDRFSVKFPGWNMRVPPFDTAQDAVSA